MSIKALATKINLSGGRATGASFVHNGQTHSINVKREMIVSGGVVGSPQILELSGIGNPDILLKAGIQCTIENYAIGENLQDHVCAMVVVETPDSVSMDSLAEPEWSQAAMLAYQTRLDGPFSSASTVQGFLTYKRFASDGEVKDAISSIEAIKGQNDFVRRQRQTIIAHLRNDTSANLQFMPMAGTMTMQGAGDDSILAAPMARSDGVNGVTIGVGLQYPVSRGSTHITSSNASDHPDYDPAFLSHQSDIDVLAAGLKFCHQTTLSEPLASKVGKRIAPSPDLDLKKTEDCKEAVKGNYTSFYHPCGSVAMGDALNSRLVVKGTENIRVVDASVFPGHVSGNIQGTVYAVAEKAADLIMEDLKLSISETNDGSVVSLGAESIVLPRIFCIARSVPFVEDELNILLTSHRFPDWKRLMRLEML